MADRGAPHLHAERADREEIFPVNRRMGRVRNFPKYAGRPNRLTICHKVSTIEGMQSFKVETSKRGFRVCGLVQLLGKDLLISLWGGTNPHIGAVGMAEPRPSLKDPRKWSATSSNFTFLGHKEDILVKRIAEKIASQIRVHVVVVAGIHWDPLSLREIRLIEKLCLELGDLILKRLRTRL